MAITNYGELKTAIANWLDRSDLTSKIPDFITLGEAAFFRNLRCPGNEQWVTYPASSLISETFQIPNDFLEAKVVMWGDKPLTRISDIKYLMLRNNSNAASTPKYFCRLKDQLYMYPPADTQEDINLIYWQTQGPMVEDSDYTRTLVYAPDAYLFSALLEAQSYLIGDERLQVWGARLAAALTGIQDMADDGEIGGSTMSINNVYGD